MRTLSIIVLLSSPAAAQAPVNDGAPNLPNAVPAFTAQTDAPQITSGMALTQEVIAATLVHPWSVAVLPDGAGYLVTERGGALLHITRDGTIGPQITGVPNVRALQQGGLLDVTLAPDFAQSRVIYLTYAARDGLTASATAVARAVLSADHTALGAVEELWRQTPSSVVPAHFGSRVLALPDGTLFVTTGDRFTPANRALAQDPSAAYGVTVHITADGAPVPNAPIADGALPEVLTYGHRNIQGAATHPETGAIWTLEHGPAGGDELNIITPGANYGWPEVSYGLNYNGSEVGTGAQAHAPTYVEPRYFWDPSIAPSDLVFYDGEMFSDWQGDILMGALAGLALVRLEMDGDTVTGEERLLDGQYRVRDVAIDSDGAILVISDSDEGRLIRLTPEGT